MIDVFYFSVVSFQQLQYNTSLELKAVMSCFVKLVRALRLLWNWILCRNPNFSHERSQDMLSSFGLELSIKFSWWCYSLDAFIGECSITVSALALTRWPTGLVITEDDQNIPRWKKKPKDNRYRKQLLYEWDEKPQYCPLLSSLKYTSHWSSTYYLAPTSSLFRSLCSGPHTSRGLEGLGP